MKIKFKSLVVSLPALLLGLGYLSTAKSNAVVVSAVTTVSQSEIDDYYANIDDEAQGKTLLEQLNTLNNKKRKKTVGYAGFRNFASKCDIDPTGSGKIVGFYDNTLVGPSWDGGDTWNREHMWPNSRGGSKVEADAHMIRPASTKINSERRNNFFAENGAYDPGQYYAEYRGISARIIFYCAIADPSLKIIDALDDAPSHNTMGKLSDLLKWNLEYNSQNTQYADTLAIKTEINRNNVIQKDSNGQGNRNPFIDHPEYACKIWGNTNDDTKEICKGQVEEVTLTSIELSDVKTEYNVGDEFVKPTVTAHYSDKSSKDVTNNAYFAGYDLDYPGEQTVVVTYSDTMGMQQTSYTINVIGEVPLVDLEVVNPQTEYEIGDEFVKPQVNAINVDGDRIDVNDEVTFTGFDSTKVGTITVTAHYEDLQKGFEVEIKEPMPITSFTLSKDELELVVGQESKLFAKIEPEEYSSQSLEWTSSDENIATVQYGKVKAVSIGETEIQARIEGTKFIATCKVVVKEEEPIPTPSEVVTPTPTSSTPTPVVTPTPTPEVDPTKPAKKGCSGSIIATSVVICASSLIGAALLISKRRK